MSLKKNVLAAGLLLFGLGILSLRPERVRREEKALSSGTQEQEEPGPYLYVEEDMELLAAYQSYNEDVIGLIRIPDTVLDHPLVQTPDKEDYYLRKDLDHKDNSHGVPFLSAESRMEGRGNMVVFGHNIYRVSRDVFADLAGYEDLDFYKEHPVVETVSKSGTRKWLIFAYYIVDNADSDPFRYSEVTSFASQKQFDAYFQEVKKRNWLFVPVPVGIEDTFLTLSSCSLELGGTGTNRMVVMARQLAVGEEYMEAVAEAELTKDPLLPQKLRIGGDSDAH